MDRRIKRTRTAVFNAVLDLMVEKDTSKITVLELCKRADINKSTFYLHYKSMDDCLQNCFQIIMNGIINIQRRLIIMKLSITPNLRLTGFLTRWRKILNTFQNSSRAAFVHRQ